MQEGEYRCEYCTDTVSLEELHTHECETGPAADAAGAIGTATASARTATEEEGNE